jgi:hypothetical protein
MWDIIPLKECNLTIKSNLTSGTATFRLGQDTLGNLREEAEQKRTSLNTLVSQVLQSHTEYHTLAARAGLISVSKSLLITIMESMDPQEVTRLSQYIAKNELKDTILLMKRSYNKESIVDFIESWARASGFPYRHHRTKKGTLDGNDEDNNPRGYHGAHDNNHTPSSNMEEIEHSFLIQHDMGEKWSTYFIELFGFAFEQLGIKIDGEHTANTISIKI